MSNNQTFDLVVMAAKIYLNQQLERAKKFIEQAKLWVLSLLQLG